MSYPASMIPLNLPISGIRPALMALASTACLPLMAQGDPDFGSYWYRGKAELNRYDLTISRYGEERPGDAVLVFVTEPFDRDAQVKSDSGRGVTSTVLKLNQVLRFTTGVYDYSLMKSVFTPVEAGEKTLKVTASIQDWCGQVWQQINRRKDSLLLTIRSYFESEGDRDLELPDAFLEDAVFPTIRIDPERLPTGSFRAVPGSLTVRLRHLDPRPQAARGSVEEIPADGEQPARGRYVLEYPNQGRRLEVTFEAASPHRILEWREIAGRGSQETTLLRAVRSHEVVSDYWNRNGNRDEPMRERLGLPRSR